jgi:putative ABC transport system permease protein
VRGGHRESPGRAGDAGTALGHLRARPRRLALTGVSIAIGVAFLAGTLIYGETAKAAFFDDLARAARNVDVAVTPTRGRTFAETPRRVDFEALAAIRAVPGVRRVDGRVAQKLPMLDRYGRLIGGRGDTGWAISLATEPSLAQYDLVAGRLPQRAGEVAVDRSTVDSSGFRLGDGVRVLGADRQPAPLTLVGVLDLGANKRFGGQSVAALTDEDLRSLTGAPGYAEIVVGAAPGVAPAVLARRVFAALAGRYPVATGDRVRTELARSAAKYVDGLLRVLLGFGLLGLGVAGFLIHNTFTVLVTQRTRELALLRCVGATRGQLFRAVMTESLVVGLLAATAGLGLGVAVGLALIAARNEVGGGVPVHRLVVSPAAVLVALGVGVLATVLAALRPAHLASRVPPIAALRLAAGPAPAGRRRWPRLVAATVPAATGLTAIATAVPSGFAGIPVAVAGAIAVFAAPVVISPAVVPWLANALAAGPARLLGPPVRLAARNAGRDPRRVAATTGAVLVGLGLMSMVSVLLATAKAQGQRELAENFPADYVITGVYAGGPRDTGIPLEVAATLRGRPELSAAAGCRVAGASIGGRRMTAWTAEPGSLTGALRPEVMAGVLGERHPGTLALDRIFAASVGVRVGDAVTVAAGGSSRVLTVEATLDDAPIAGQALLDWADFTALFGPGEADQVLVKAATGVSRRASREAVEAALRDHPLAQVSGPAQWRAQLSAALDEQLTIFATLLGILIVIGLAGIATTTHLSVLERTREFATLRAMGLTARQLLGMVLAEGLLVGTVAGVTGIALGTGLGFAAGLGLIREYGHGWPTVPVAHLASFAVLGALAVAVTAVLPSRAAAGISVVSAIADE